MYQEQFSSKGGPSSIKIEDGKAKWSLDLGGVVYTGEVDVEQAGGQEPALAQARRDVEATAVNPPAPVDEPAVLGAGTQPSQAPVEPEPVQVDSDQVEDLDE